MNDNKKKYDPAVYGQLRASFLQRLDITSPAIANDEGIVIDDEEKRRRTIIQEIKERKLVIIR
jgi:hypothetical protein